MNFHLSTKFFIQMRKEQQCFLNFTYNYAQWCNKDTNRKPNANPSENANPIFAP